MKFAERIINQLVFLILFISKDLYEFYLNRISLRYVFTGTVLIVPLLFIFYLFIISEAVEWIKEQNKQTQLYES